MQLNGYNKIELDYTYTLCGYRLEDKNTFKTRHVILRESEYLVFT